MPNPKRIVTVSGLCAAFPDIFPSENAVRLRTFKRQLPYFKQPNSNRVLFDLDVIEQYLTSQRVGTSDELRTVAATK